MINYKGDACHLRAQHTRSTLSQVASRVAHLSPFIAENQYFTMLELGVQRESWFGASDRMRSKRNSWLTLDKDELDSLAPI